MESNAALSSVLILLCLTFHFTNAVTYTETLGMGQPIRTSDSLVSANGNFELGFFERNNSSNYYVGIWFKNIPTDNIVWVANRNNPASDNSSAVFEINEEGNLVVKDDKVVYSVTTFSNISGTRAVLLDSGNLVLLNSNLNILWQSFDDPTDTLLPGMTMRTDTYEEFLLLRSWTSADDPSPGVFSVEIAIDAGVEDYGFRYRDIKTKPDDDEYWYYSYSGNFSFKSDTWKKEYSSRLVLEVSGELKQQFWSKDKKQWTSLESSRCSKSASCGNFSICNPQDPNPCECLKGFTHYNSNSWKQGRNASAGCVRKTELRCTNISNNGLDDRYFALDKVDFVSDSLLVFQAENASTCQKACSKDCSCVAYAYNFTGSCLLWHDQLLNLINATVDGGDDRRKTSVFLKLAASELISNELNSRNEPGPKLDDKHNHSRKILYIIIALILFVALLTLVLFAYCYRGRKLKGIGEDLLLFDVGMSMKVNSSELTDLEKTAKVNKREVKLPLFSLASVSVATDNFSAANKLGEGGFGPVYKGKLLNGDEVAVKRLSTRSGQGWEELRNEALLIAKLQHNNLVRLLGCCIERDEKMLIYEFMPNKSLDFFLFDATKSRTLDWETRVRIIDGIAQGLLYLHQYSRFRIIHRDLKASNILLDINMNPKISDFGMARMFGGNELQANTNRIVGTYGYMSPEYAIEGLFSIKSDVFSFGILLLEIISGKKNTGFYNSNSLNLLGYAWDLWTSGRGTELMDSVVEDASINKMVVLRYVNIALLCVQECASERPTMADVVSLLGNDNAVLPYPKSIAFLNVRGTRSSRSDASSAENVSINAMTASIMEAR